MENKNPLKVLVSGFACGPSWGSEVGMGWNWITNLAQYCELHVITETGFRNEIETEIPKLNLNNNPTFYFIDIGDKARELFWKQGSLLFYVHYRKWQKKAFDLSKNILQDQHIDLIHQLNLIGFREPGYLWKHGEKYPYVWGPLGGINQIPVSYILHFEVKNLVFYSLKHLINKAQLLFSPRVIKALKASTFVVAESSNTQNILLKNFKIPSVLIHETGCKLPVIKSGKKNNSFIELIWVGKLQGTKALPIALRALSKVKEKDRFRLTIIGDGDDENSCRSLAKNLGIENICQFLGKITNKEVIMKMENSDLLFFTSLKEGTATVVLEALSVGLPVLCHNKCGFGDIINENCGIKIPMTSYKLSIKYFADSLSVIANDKSILTKLSDGALIEREQHTWKRISEKMYNLYSKASGKS